MGVTGYAERRRAFVKAMGQGVAIIAAAPQSTRSNDVEYRYRQDNDLLYLTGFAEPNCLCVLAAQHEEERFILFVQPRDREKETWTGKRYGVDGAREVFGADAAYTIEQVREILPAHLAQTDEVYFAPGRDERMNTLIQEFDRREPVGARPHRPGRGVAGGSGRHYSTKCVFASQPGNWTSCARLWRPPHARMQRPCAKYAKEASNTSWRRCWNTTSAPPAGRARPIRPSSPPAPTRRSLHYTQNDRRMRDGDLVLIDAGAEFDGYCSDVTRTFPVGADYSPPQRRIYEIVLRAQKEAIATVRPGVSMEDIHRRATEVLVDGLLDIGLLSGEAGELIEKGAHARFYMHRTGHWLGLDVHDVGRYRVDGASRPLEPGMVLTVEPGLYIAEDLDDVSAEYLGIGVRIEDDVLVTESGHEVLSAAILKEVDDIEAVRGEALAAAAG